MHGQTSQVVAHRPSSGLSRAFHLANRTSPRVRCVQRCHKAPQLGFQAHPQKRTCSASMQKGDHAKKQRNAQRAPAPRKGATHNAKIHGQTSRVVRLRADLHRGCHVRSICQTRTSPRVLGAHRCHKTQQASHPHALSPACSHLRSLLNYG